MSKIKPTEAEIALHREQERMKQVAAHHCSAYIALSRGVEQGMVNDSRPGKEPVTQLTYSALMVAAEVELLKRFLFDSVLSRHEYTAALTNALAAVNKQYATDINGNKLGLLASFAFQPVADPEPKDVDDGSE